MVAQSDLSRYLYGLSAGTQLLLALGFYALSRTASQSVRRRLSVLSSMATTIASFAALLQAADIGFVDINDRTVSWVRYADYALATPLLLHQLQILLMMDVDDCVVGLLLQFLTIVSGLAGALTEELWISLVLGIFGGLLFFGNICLLYAAARRPERPVSTVSKRFVAATMLTWTLYPAWWALNRTEAVSGETAAMFNLLFDALCKGLFGIILGALGYRNRQKLFRSNVVGPDSGIELGATDTPAGG